MELGIIEYLKGDDDKILVIDGARQIGKSFIIREMCKKYVNSTNFENLLKNSSKRTKVKERIQGEINACNLEIEKLNNKNVNVISDGINLYHKADMAGDEPYWLAVNLNMCAVLTCSNRYKAAKYAIEKLGVKTIILDDGFQHRKIYRDLDIVLVDSEKMFGNENLLPAGPLREGTEGFNRLNKLIIVSKNIDHSRAEKYAKIMEKRYCKKVTHATTTTGDVGITSLCKIEPDYVYNIITGEHLEYGSEVTLLSAIGQPEQFYKFIEPNYKIKNKITFDDHHQYALNDIENIEGNIEKTVSVSSVKKNDMVVFRAGNQILADGIVWICWRRLQMMLYLNIKKDIYTTITL